MLNNKKGDTMENSLNWMKYLLKTNNNKVTYIIQL